MILESVGNLLILQKILQVMADLILNGAGVALVTPFNADLSVDFESLEKVIEHIVDGGCDYIVALGTTAETPTLSYKEKIEVTKFVKNKINGKIPLVIGIGGNNTNGVIQDIATRDLEGYSAILSVTPYYNKPTQEGLFQHFKAISESSPLPIILYNVPGRTGVNLTAETTLRLSELPNICGIKEASGNIVQCEEILKKGNEGFFVTSGDDALTCDLMKKGGVGVISVLANAFPKEVKSLVRLCQQNNYPEASKLQNLLNPFIGNLFEDGNPAGVKAVLSKIGLLKNVLRLPLVPVSKRLDEKLEKEAKKLFDFNR